MHTPILCYFITIIRRKNCAGFSADVGNNGNCVSVVKSVSGVCFLRNVPSVLWTWNLQQNTAGLSLKGASAT